MEPQSQKQSLAIPVAIVVGFGLIAAAIFFSGASATTPAQVGTTNTTQQQAVAQPETQSTPIRPINEDDYVRGNPNAPIVIVEYSDYDCPFCKRFHDTMNRIIGKYGASGDVAWVYRHFPIPSLHPNAPAISVAAECVGELGGNEAFWTFSDLVFDERGTNEPTAMARLPEFAATAGVSEAAFNECIASGRHEDKIDASVNEAIKAGARGTPHSFVLVGDQQGVINGAQPFETVDRIIADLITQIENTAPGS